MENLNITQNETIKFCRDILLKEPTHISYPRGFHKHTRRINFENETVIITKRDNEKRARLENKVLMTMNMHGAAVPKIIHEQDGWLVQEDVGNQSLIEVIAKLESPFEKTLCLKSALNNLLNIHQIAHDTSLTEDCAYIGTNSEWLKKFILTPSQIGTYIDFPSPELPADSLLEKLRVREPSFIKWDCRMRNAVIDMNRHDIVWLDWHHAGLRNKIDDLVWFIGDDHFPAECEDEIVKTYLQKFSAGFNTISEAYDYLAHFVTVYTSIRLFNLILIKDKAKTWEKAREVSRVHRNNVSLETAKALCDKGKRWAERACELNGLTTWFDNLNDRIEKTQKF